MTLEKPSPEQIVKEVEDKSIWKTTYDISNVRASQRLPYISHCSLQCVCLQLLRGCGLWQTLFS